MLSHAARVPWQNILQSIRRWELVAISSSLILKKFKVLTASLLQGGWWMVVKNSWSG